MPGTNNETLTPIERAARAIDEALASLVATKSYVASDDLSIVALAVLAAIERELKHAAWREGRDAAQAAITEWRNTPFDPRKPGDVIPALKSPYEEPANDTD